jgi:glutathione S-transferase
MSFGGRDRLWGMQLYYHPRSPYSHKVMIALAEKRVAFEPVMVRPDDERFAKLTPIKKVPLLVLADGWKIPESTIIIEYLDAHFSTGTRLIPEDRDRARQTRFHDRITDLYITESLMTLLFERGGATGAAEARTRIDSLFTGFDGHLGKNAWVMGDTFTMADCALVPALRYARELHPFERFENIAAYFTRALQRPSVKGVFDEVAPHLAIPTRTNREPAQPTLA